jgi:hypothetical protein
MKLSVRLGICTAVVALVAAMAMAHGAAAQSGGDSQARPPVAKADIDIVKRARQLLDSPEKWNRNDNRICPDTEKTFSLYCALEKATDEVSGNFAHRGAAMQEARFVIDQDLAPNNSYEHRLMNYNNDPKTTFADVQKFFDLLQERIEKRLKEQESNPQLAGARPAVPRITKTDIEVVKKVEEILDSPAKWDRASTQDCVVDAKTFGLYCAFAAASIALTGKFDDDAPGINEVRQLISRTAPNAPKYTARLVDYNNDPTVTFADLRKLLKTAEENLTKRMAEPEK